MRVIQPVFSFFSLVLANYVRKMLERSVRNSRFLNLFRIENLLDICNMQLSLSTVDIDFLKTFPPMPYIQYHVLILIRP